MDRYSDQKGYDMGDNSYTNYSKQLPQQTFFTPSSATPPPASKESAASGKARDSDVSSTGRHSLELSTEESARPSPTLRKSQVTAGILGKMGTITDNIKATLSHSDALGTAFKQNFNQEANDLYEHIKQKVSSEREMGILGGSGMTSEEKVVLLSLCQAEVEGSAPAIPEALKDSKAVVDAIDHHRGNALLGKLAKSPDVTKEFHPQVLDAFKAVVNPNKVVDPNTIVPVHDKMEPINNLPANLAKIRDEEDLSAETFGAASLGLEMLVFQYEQEHKANPTDVAVENKLKELYAGLREIGRLKEARCNELVKKLPAADKKLWNDLQGLMGSNQIPINNRLALFDALLNPDLQQDARVIIQNAINVAKESKQLKGTYERAANVGRLAGQNAMEMDMLKGNHIEQHPFFVENMNALVTLINSAGGSAVTQATQDSLKQILIGDDLGVVARLKGREGMVEVKSNMAISHEKTLFKTGYNPSESALVPHPNHYERGNGQWVKNTFVNNLDDPKKPSFDWTGSFAVKQVDGTFRKTEAKASLNFKNFSLLDDSGNKIDPAKRELANRFAYQMVGKDPTGMPHVIKLRENCQSEADFEKQINENYLLGEVAVLLKDVPEGQKLQTFQQLYDDTYPFAAAIAKGYDQAIYPPKK